MSSVSIRTTGGELSGFSSMRSIASPAAVPMPRAFWRTVVSAGTTVAGTGDRVWRLGQLEQALGRREAAVMEKITLDDVLRRRRQTESLDPGAVAEQAIGSGASAVVTADMGDPPPPGLVEVIDDLGHRLDVGRHHATGVLAEHVVVDEDDR